MEIEDEDIKYELSGEYTKLCIYENTLVPKGAVMERAVYKSVNGKTYKQIKTVEKMGNDEKLELHSIMYMLNKKDSHGNFISNPKVLEDACGDFMKNGDKQVRMTHEGELVEASVMQLYIVPENHPLWSDKKYVGAIANVIKFDDVELYKYCKDNDFETSIGGVAEEAVIPVEKTNMFKKMFNIIMNQLKLEGILPMNKGKDVEKVDETVDENPTVKPETETAPEEVKKEIDPMVVEYVATIVNELVAKYDAKYDELKTMIEGNKPKSEIDPEEVIELKKEIKELRKEVGKSSQIDSVQTVKKAKTMLS